MQTVPAVAVPASDVVGGGAADVVEVAAGEEPLALEADRQDRRVGAAVEVVPPWSTRAPAHDRSARKRVETNSGNQRSGRAARCEREDGQCNRSCNESIRYLPELELSVVPYDTEKDRTPEREVAERVLPRLESIEESNDDVAGSTFQAF